MSKASRQQTPGRALARERALWVRDRAVAEVRRLRVAIAQARARRRAALSRARQQCAVARGKVRQQIKAFRSREFARINAEAARMRNAARAQCQARKHRVRSAGANAIARKLAELAAEERMHRRLRRADSQAQRERTTYKERRQESDDAVRSNLPRELVPVFDRVKGHIRGSRHRTRTEQFLEWAEEHPEDVIAYQGDDSDREVARLVREHEAAERELARAMRKTAAPRRARRVAGDDVPF
jgi:hypothetical protein